MFVSEVICNVLSPDPKLLPTQRFGYSFLSYLLSTIFAMNVLHPQPRKPVVGHVNVLNIQWKIENAFWAEQNNQSWDRKSLWRSRAWSILMKRTFRKGQHPLLRHSQRLSPYKTECSPFETLLTKHPSLATWDHSSLKQSLFGL